MSGNPANATPKAWRGGLGVATLLLAGCLPAAAQNLLLPARTTPATAPAFSASLRFPPLAVSSSDSSILATGIPADYPGQSLASAAQSLTESVATPFLARGECRSRHSQAGTLN
jgi:hypothetical protein